MTYFSWLLVSAGLALSPFSHAGSGPPPRAMSTTQAAQGWLTTEETITIRKLAYRCSFYLRRSAESESGDSGRVK